MPAPLATFRQYMTPKERSQWSLVRLISSIAEKQNSFEREVGQTAARDLGTPDGCWIPPEVLFNPDAGRALTATGAPSGGGYTIGNEVGPLVDYVYPQSVTAQLGA